MRPRATLLALPALLSVAWLALSSPLAQASSGNISARVRLVYEQDDTIPPCLFTSQELTTAQNAVDAYDLEYFADYIGAIQTALTLRAAGACSKGTRHVSQAPVGRTPPAAPLPATLTSSTSSGVPLPILLMAVFALGLGVAATVLTLGRGRASFAAAAGRWRHGAAEAGYRARGVWDTIMGRLKR